MAVLYDDLYDETASDLLMVSFLRELFWTLVTLGICWTKKSFRVVPALLSSLGELAAPVESMDICSGESLTAIGFRLA